MEALTNATEYSNPQEYFGPLNERTARIRARLLDTQPTVDTQRALLTTESYRAHEQDQVVLRRAYMLDNVLRNMSIYIDPDALLVGNQASSDRSAPIFPEYAMDWVIKELDAFDKRDGDRFTITEENKQILRDIYPYWKGRTLQDKGYAAFPEQARLFYDLGIIKTEGNITSGDAHIAVEYARILREGLDGYRARVLEQQEKLELANFEDLKKSYFYRSILIVLDAVEAFSLRYATLAEEQAKTAAPERAVELLEIARICRKVPMQPAESFHEALQSVWLLHVVLQIESNGHSLSYGRMDQYVYPLYEKSRAEGMSEERACELLENLWLRTFTVNKIRSWSHTRFSAGSPLYQNVTVGGQTVDGKDAVNELSYKILKTVARCHLPQPNLTVRYHKGLSDAFMQECIQVIRCGFGMPAFNSDEIIIPSFLNIGVAKKDAYNYSAIGCVEVAVPGKWGYRCTGMSFLNFPKTLMIALNDGIDIDSGKRVFAGTGHFLNMEKFDNVMKAWDIFVREFCRQAVILDSSADMVLEQEVPDILCSALTEDCIARGKHLKEGGAVYDFISDLQVGIANLGDSLAAIKKTVYEDKSVTREELWNALLTDFAGERGEEIRKLLLAVPKFGNDDDYVDSLVVEGYDSYIDELKKYKNTRYGRGPIGGTYYAGTSSISANVPQGAGTCATPDGRHKGDPLAEGCSPTHAADVNGPTAVFKSVSKLRTDKITGGVLLNQKVAPSMLEKPRDRQKLLMLLRTFFNALKGFHVQFNVVSRETMLDAQIHPEQHKDLIVRVAGYSAFFNVLSRQTQDDIIARTEQVL
ncbi:MAG: formate C-acetyltransferase/glycerol dehydratase family glycyl radical enzyme [Firmicutes bacterium HGW-Firmicutes-9]|jgi:formate C-acetyltransferase|nr:MAG: formate C-acetyltransferase/glycerol dehydratase family glycyl radical enzyme [Firmicutes bacterium HGW-Firmicutes-9]